MQIERCSYCGSTNLGIGYQMGNGQIFPDIYAYHSTASGSTVEHIICKDCGAIVHSRVSRPSIFTQYSAARQQELLDYINEHGILLCNENGELPSLCSLGYSMENIISLIEQKQVFYCKAYKKRSTYLSVQVYQHLMRCRERVELTDTAKSVLNAMRDVAVVDKDSLRLELGIDKKQFDKAFDLLLEQLYITAIGGKRLNPNWYSYLYCTAEVWRKGVEGLHYNGDSKQLLRGLLPDMGDKDFISFTRQTKTEAFNP